MSSERVTAIKAFRRSLALLEEAYGVKLEAEDDGDLLIIDTTRKLPSGYHYDAKITVNGDVRFMEWIDEAGETKK